ncbi:universal stress protein [Haladaptatus sp. NG-SE-30]
MYERILVPTDGGSATRGAANHAVDIAEQYDATVHALHVVSDQLGEDRDELEAEGERATDDIVELASDHGLDAVGAVLEGRPSDSILDYVDDNDVDLIVMATQGRSGVGRMLLGSVAERVVRKATVPVLLVRASGERTIESPEQATTVAKETLTAEGYDDVSVTEEPYRAANTWIVRANGDGQTFNVHVDPVTGDTSVARIRSRE